MSRRLLVIVLGLWLTACTTTDPYTREEKTSSATKGAVIGAAAGAVVGAIANNSKGALIGAAVGALAGGGIGHYMDKQEAELRKQLEGTGVSVTREGNNIHLNMPGNITFDTNKTQIRDPFYPVLDSVVTVATEFDQTSIRVAGHTDSTGSASYNQRLSEHRALSVKDYLGLRGIASPRLSSVGYGENYPVADNANVEGRALNRRVELEMIPTQ